jgi:hypothetical protein
MGTVFKVGAVSTLVFDAYLLLSLLAITRMKTRYESWLPPLGSEFGRSIPGVVVVVVVLWTALLAIGCLARQRLSK